MPAKPEIAGLIQRCAFDPHMPKHSVDLAEALKRLSPKQRRRANALMRRKEIRLPDRMGRRATEICHFNPEGAIQIVEAMRQLFRSEVVLRALQTSSYVDKQMKRAARHQDGGNSALARLIYDHIRDLIDGEELAAVVESTRFYTGPELKFDQSDRPHLPSFATAAS